MDNEDDNDSGGDVEVSNDADVDAVTNQFEDVTVDEADDQDVDVWCEGDFRQQLMTICPVDIMSTMIRWK